MRSVEREFRKSFLGDAANGRHSACDVPAAESTLTLWTSLIRTIRAATLMSPAKKSPRTILERSLLSRAERPSRGTRYSRYCFPQTVLYHAIKHGDRTMGVVSWDDINESQHDASVSRAQSSFGGHWSTSENKGTKGSAWAYYLLDHGDKVLTADRHRHFAAQCTMALGTHPAVVTLVHDLPVDITPPFGWTRSPTVLRAVGHMFEKDSSE